MTARPKTATIPRLPSDPCERLAMVEAALYQLASGQKRVEIRHGEYWTRYGEGSVPFLERERARLMALCPAAGGRQAITIGRSQCAPYPRRYK
jgi:hypothetical protein